MAADQADGELLTEQIRQKAQAKAFVLRFFRFWRDHGGEQRKKVSPPVLFCLKRNGQVKWRDKKYHLNTYSTVSLPLRMVVIIKKVV